MSEPAVFPMALATEFAALNCLLHFSVLLLLFVVVSGSEPASA
jgi:hypothetical protein